MKDLSAKTAACSAEAKERGKEVAAPINSDDPVFSASIHKKNG